MGVTVSQERLKTVFMLAGKKLGPEAQKQLQQFLTPEALYIAGGIIVAWIVGHGVGIGLLVDAVITAVGFIAVGFAIFEGLDELFAFARLTLSDTGDLDEAATHLARAIDILTITAVLALLFRNRPRSAVTQTENAIRRPKAVFTIEDPPPMTSRWRYTPRTIHDPTLVAGDGQTSFWADMWLSTNGTKLDQELVALHERIHQIMSPKVNILRNQRVLGRAGTYLNSSLYRFLEEMVAETRAQVGAIGWRKFFVGVRFPTKNGYLYLFRSGSRISSDWKGLGLIPEGAGLLATIPMMDMTIRIWQSGSAPADITKYLREKSRYLFDAQDAMRNQQRIGQFR